MPRSISVKLNGRIWMAIDDMEIDSDLLTPADGWSFTIYQPLSADLSWIKAGSTIEIKSQDEVVLTGIVDTVQQSITRDGRSIRVAGRDLAGQLLDCSVPLFVGQEISLEETIGRFVTSGSLGQLFHNLIAKESLNLAKKIGVQPGESVWVAVEKAAKAQGQYLWLNADGSLQIGNPFQDIPQPKKPIVLVLSSKIQNVLSMDYMQDVSQVYSEIKVLAEANDSAGSFTAGRRNRLNSQAVIRGDKKADYQASATQALAHERLRIVIDGEVNSQAEAEATAQKILHDSNLSAHTLNVTLDQWHYDDDFAPWQIGWRVGCFSDLISGVTGKWVIVRRTFTLSRTQGAMTRLTLKREGDWMNPVVHQDEFKGQAYRAKRKARSKAHRNALKAARSQSKAP